MAPIPLPPLQFAGGGAGGGSAGGPSPWNQGDWTINLGGSGVNAQAAAGGGSGLSPWLIALAVGAAWLLLRK